ncbi:MAG: PEGA domain-containing protein [Labilithrix sp.]
MAVVATLLATGCAHVEERSAAPVALVVQGREPLRVAAEKGALAGDYGVTVRAAAVPNTPPAPMASTAETEQHIASARRRYLDGGFEGAQRCAAELASPSLVWGAIGAGARSTALRVLLWKTACDSIFQEDAALTDAQTFAALEAELPPEANAIPVRANELLGRALAEAEKSGRRTLLVSARNGESAIHDASVSVDGRASACKTPCSLDLRPGDHWLRVERDGFSSSARLVRVDVARVSQSAVFELPVASPEEAGRQWTSRYATTNEPVDGAASLELLSLAVRARQVLYLRPEPFGAGVRIQGALARDGKIVARESREDADLAHLGGRSRDVAMDLLVKGRVVEDPSLFKKPLFWVVVVGVAAGAAVALTAYATRGEEHSLTTQVRVAR